jgi:hypothetical protein
MRKQDYQQAPYEKAEWRMALDLSGCTNITVEGVRLESSGGDGIYVGCTAKQPYCENITIRDVVCDDNHRQGISVIGAKNLLIENCVLSRTGGTAPEAGIDFEPNNANEKLVNCTMRNCIVEANEGAGIFLYLKQFTAETEPVSVLIESCYVRSGKEAGLGVGAVAGVKGDIEFRNCTVENTQRAGAYIYDKSADGARVKFTNCNWRNVALNEKLSPIMMHLRRTSVADNFGGVAFAGCSLFDDMERPAVVIESKDPALEARDVAGEIIVHSSHEPKLDVGLKKADLALKLIQAPAVPAEK